MEVQINGVDSHSHFYLHTPSVQAKELYLYPLYVGHYFYNQTYYLERENYTGYLIMYIKSGECTIETKDGSFPVKSSQAFLIDSKQWHAYYSQTNWEALWLHFDGTMARPFFSSIIASKGYVIPILNSFSFEKLLSSIYQIFHENHIISEPILSKYITNLLTELLFIPTEYSKNTTRIHESVRYVHNHFTETLSVNMLAAKAYLSPYYFIRLFKKETGLSPHNYLISVRVSTAKYYLKTTTIPIKEIAILCGFTNESSFCNTFKKQIGSSPKTYRGKEYF